MNFQTTKKNYLKTLKPFSHLSPPTSFCYNSPHEKQLKNHGDCCCCEGTGAGYAIGQLTSETRRAIYKAASAGGGYVTAAELEKVAKNPDLTKEDISLALDWDNRAKPTDTMLLALQCQQNAEIIRLLKEQAKDKKAR